MIALDIARREARLLLRSTRTYALIAGHALLHAILFAAVLGAYTAQSSQQDWAQDGPPLHRGLLLPLLRGEGLLQMLLAPLYAMRSLAGEDDRRTMPLLLGSAAPDGAVVVGKWLAIAAVSCVVPLLATVHAGAALLPISELPPRLLWIGSAAGLPLAMWGAAAGLAGSAWARTTAAAGALGLLLTLLPWLLGAVPSGPLAWLSPAPRYDRAISGVLDPVDAIWFAATTALWLRAAATGFERRRWP